MKAVTKVIISMRIEICIRLFYLIGQIQISKNI